MKAENAGFFFFTIFIHLPIGVKQCVAVRLCGLFTPIWPLDDETASPLF